MSTLHLVSEETASSPSYDFVKLQNNFHWNCHVFGYALVTKDYMVALRVFQKIIASPTWLCAFVGGLAYYQSKDKNMWKGFKWNYLVASVFLRVAGATGYILDQHDIEEIEFDEDIVKSYIEWLKN